MDMSDSTRLRLEPADEGMHPVEEAVNFNESMYVNVFDHARQLGGWFRVGNRPNEGHAEMSCCLYLPDGRVGFMHQRPTIADNAALDRAGMRFEVLEAAFRVLRDERPSATGEPRLVHGDFRVGNLAVGPGGLAGVLDWELTHLGDPVEDLGWLCVAAWRFGGAGAVGGVGDRGALLAAYERASGRAVDPGALRYWELFGNVKWAVICQFQAYAHLRGAARSVERAVIGRRVAEVEREVLRLLRGEREEATCH